MPIKKMIKNDTIFKQFGDPSEPILSNQLDKTSFNEISIKHDKSNAIFWFYMDQKQHPCYTYELGEEVEIVHSWMKANYGNKPISHNSDLKYFVTGSRAQGIFNLGGDLSHFSECIEKNDFSSLKRYAQICVRMQYDNYNSFNAPVITIALVQGDALGGGFEHALASDIIIAEKNARMGLPEILFNLFPGMGAYSFLMRRVGSRLAEQMILGGKIYTASELYEIGIVDILAENGQGEAAVAEYIEQHKQKYPAEVAIHRARKYAQPVTHDELLHITDMWVETAKTLDASNIKKMRRFVRMQKRRLMTTA